MGPMSNMTVVRLTQTWNDQNYQRIWLYSSSYKKLSEMKKTTGSERHKLIKINLNYVAKKLVWFLLICLMNFSVIK